MTHFPAPHPARYYSLYFILSLIFLASSAIAETPKKTIITATPPPFKTELTHAYFISALKLALDNTVQEYGDYELKFSLPMYSTPALLELSRKEGVLDIVWTGTSTKREGILLAIQIPLLRGMLGYRSALMHKRIAARYESITTLKQLQAFSICQGENWPDSDILEDNGLTVMRYKNFEPMIEAVYNGDCDIFLRGIHEAPSEISQRLDKYPDLTLLETPLIYYPFPMYFFLGKYNQHLHERITIGLNIALAQGQIADLIRQHPITRHLSPISRWQKNPTIILKNRSLTALPDLYHSDYWIKPH